MASIIYIYYLYKVSIKPIMVLRYFVASFRYQEGLSHFIQLIFMIIGTPSLRELLNIRCTLMYTSSKV